MIYEYTKLCIWSWLWSEASSAYGLLVFLEMLFTLADTFQEQQDLMDPNVPIAAVLISILYFVL